MKFQFLVVLVIPMLLEDRNHAVLSQDPDMWSYKTPKGCEAYETRDRLGVALRCIIPGVNHKLLNTTFEIIPTKYTKSLEIMCNSVFGNYIQSSFETVSLSHLSELEEIIFNNCKFSNVTRDVFTGLHNLRYLTIRCHHDQFHTLLIQNSAIRHLQSLQLLDFANNNFKRFPKDELCHLDNVQQVFLQNNNLTDITDLGFSGPCGDEAELCCKTLSHIYLAFNNFSALPTQSFCRVPTLKLLNLVGNNLALIETGAFSHLKSLLWLYLSVNNITLIPPNLWLDLNQLLELNVSHNHISGTIDENTFQHLENLEILDLSFNQVELIHSTTFKNLTKLMDLYLSSNKIQHISDDTFSQLGNLTSLFLDHNAISSLSETSLFGLKNLLLFWINDNTISSISDNTFTCCPLLLNVSLANNALGKLPNLTILPDLLILDVSYNSIESLPTNAFHNMKNLTAINLKHNNLEEISDKHFANLTNLVLLNLSENQITRIHPQSFKTNSNLGYLQLRMNYLATLINLQENSQLVYLNLSHNSLKNLDYGMLPSSLKRLAVDHNQIASIQTNFYTAKNIPITHLDLSRNKITRITTTSLPPTLVFVNLDHNNISYIDSNSFISMKDLQEVSMQGNNLRTFSKSVIQTDTSFRRPMFYLAGNSWKCTCDTLWMQSINSAANQQYGLIQDLDYLYCWMPSIRNVPRLQLIIKTDPTDFLCHFESYEFSAAFFCPTTDKRSCNPICPENCLCFHDMPWRNIIIDCKGSSMSSIPPNIPVQTTVLYMDGTFITSVDENSFKELPKLNVLYLNHTSLKFLGENSFAHLNNLNILHLEFNHLQRLPMNSFSGLLHLRELYLFSNSLQELHEDLFTPLKSITTLQLHNNRLVNFPVWSFQKTPLLTSLTLSQNPWSCNCDYVKRYREWLQNNAGIITDVQLLKCYPENNNTVSVSLIEFNTTSCIESFPVLSDQYLVIIITVFIFISIALVCVLLFVYRHEMQVLIYSRYGVRLFHGQKEVDDECKLYDAFISYSSDDEEFVVLELIRKLESLEFPYKLCVHQRDFAVGAFITESILEAVEYSRRTILVMTENFTKSDWCRFEFKSAHLQMMKDKCNRVIMIIVGDIPNDLDPEMKLYLKTNTYLKWEDKLFWQKLYFVLPEKRPRQ